MANVTFTGIGEPLLTADQGVWGFTPGMMTPRTKQEPLTRSMGELVKELGRNGADHELILTYLKVAPEDVEGIFDLVESMWIPRLTMGTLTVPDYPPYRNCYVSECEPSPQTARARDISPANPKGTACYELTFTITFRQTRK